MSGPNVDFSQNAHGRFQCPDCDVTCSRKSDMRRHVNKHNDKFKCNTCNFSFTTERDLQEHNKKLHKTQVNEAYTCPLCQRAFYLKLHLEIHLEKSICQQPNQKIVSQNSQQISHAIPPPEPNVPKTVPIYHMPILDAPAEEQKFNTANGPHETDEVIL